ncbi:uncharacterized protein NPIL_237481 [Nephila pilipes]|uniref:Uncharacterized protein n=1 Tax=Nephila pilipes TaxID=299642 RepID=A0A8X6N961_NEPPI|nr:uncharacterized protein NPIL_237481 [Nephila pilipes]
MGTLVLLAPSELNECIRKGAIKCNEESSPLVQDILQTYSDTCTNGTEMNALFKKHGGCAFKNVANGTVSCIEAVKEQILKDQENLVDDNIKVACKNHNSTDVCIENYLNKTCGEEAVIFRRRLHDSPVKLTLEVCRKIMQDSDHAISSDDENANSVATFSIWNSIFLSLTLLLLVKTFLFY